MSTESVGPWVDEWLSAPRFGAYVSSCDGDRQRGLALYAWNARISAVIMHDLGHLEIGIRNAYDRAWVIPSDSNPAHWTSRPERHFPVRMRRAANGHSYDANARPRDQIAAAVRAAGPGAPSGKIIAELTFGFWRYLSTSSHEVRLWRPMLHRAFIRGTSRRTVDAPMARLGKLRNRVAHHEPVFRHDLSQSHADVLALASLISPNLRDYMIAASTWPAVLSERPT